MVSHKHKFIYTRTSKVASTSVLEAMGDVFDIVQFDEWDQDPRHVPLWVIKKYIPIDTYDNYFKWSFVRNPYARAVSMWKYHMKWALRTNNHMHDTFIKYMRNIADVSDRVKDLNLYDFTEGCDYIGKIESIEADLQYICSVIGIKPRKLKRRNRTQHADYSTYYCPETLDIIQSVYEKDIKQFNYTFD